MSERRQMLALAAAAAAGGEELCLVTVVRVEGSAYRKPGARMLLTSGGRRVGTVSGGCLEAEITKKAWWLAERGPVLKTYSTFYDEEAGMPYGLGCGGAVTVLVERGAHARRAMEQVAAAEHEQRPRLLLHGTAGYLGSYPCSEEIRGLSGPVRSRAQEAARMRRSVFLDDDGLFLEYLAPAPALAIFGAGDDAKPLAAFAAELGWHVTVADGRANLANAERFPAADAVLVLDYTKSLALPRRMDAAVVMTHSYDQDRALLRELKELELAYLGILGPQRRTLRLVREVAEGQADALFHRLYSPAGLDIGGDGPASIALAIVAEVQSVLAGRAPQPLREESSALHAAAW